MLTSLLQRLHTEGHLDLVVRVRPHAARSQLMGQQSDGSLKVQIAAPAEDGRGNAALLTFLAQEFQVPVVALKILAGKTGRQKLIRITGGPLL